MTDPVSESSASYGAVPPPPPPTDATSTPEESSEVTAPEEAPPTSLGNAVVQAFLDSEFAATHPDQAAKVEENEDEIAAGINKFAKTSKENEKNMEEAQEKSTYASSGQYEQEDPTQSSRFSGE